MAEHLSQSPDQALSAEERRKRNRNEILYLLEARELICTDSDLRIFQRFNELRIFLILRLQRRLATLTNELERARNDPDADIWSDSNLESFIKDIEYTLRDYDAAILAQRRIDELPSPPRKFLESFIEFCATSAPMVTNDLGATNPKNDIPHTLASISLKEKSWTHRLVDENDFLLKCLGKVVVHDRGGKIRTYSESNIRRAEFIFVNITFFLMLFFPIMALSLINNLAGKLSIVLGFLLLGAILTSGIVTRENNTGLGLLAGYGAILVFFLGVKIGIS